MGLLGEERADETKSGFVSLRKRRLSRTVGSQVTGANGGV